MDRKGRGGRIGEDGPGHGRTPSCQTQLKTRWGSANPEGAGRGCSVAWELGWGPKQGPVSALRRRAGTSVASAQRRLGSLQGEKVESQPPGASGCSLRRCPAVYPVGDSHLATDCWRPRAGVRGLRLWGHAYRDTFACRGSPPRVPGERRELHQVEMRRNTWRRKCKCGFLGHDSDSGL